MKFNTNLSQHFRWINFPGAMLMVLLQRTPVVNVLSTAEEMVISSPVGAVLKSVVATVAALGAVNTMVGATPLVPSSGSATGITVNMGSPVSVFYTVTGTQTPPASWTISGSIPPGLNFSGRTTAGTVNITSLNLAGTPTMAGTFNLTIQTFEFTNAGGVASPVYNYTITVNGAANVAPSFTTQPSGQTVTAGSSVMFSAAASGTPAPTFQWRKNGNNIAGATNTTLTINPVSAGDAGDYTVVASNTAGNVTSNTATLTVTAANSAPTFTTQPSNQAVTAGGSVTFTAAASGTPTPTYQWKKGGSNIAGATNSTFTINPVAAGDAGNYTVVASNTAGNVTSNTATLTVNAANSAPTFTTQPSSQTATAGSSVIFTAAASGTPTPTYQWRKNGNNIAGAINSTFTINPISAGDAGDYTVVASNAAGNVTSNTATLTVNAANVGPTFTQQPSSQTVNVGSSVTFTAAASGTPAPTYQWKKDGNAISGATNSTFTINPVSAGDAGNYTVVAGNVAGSIVSNVAALAVVSANGNGLSYGTNNFPVSVSAGAAVNFTFNVTNTGTKAWGANHYLAVVDAGFNLVELGALDGTAVGAGKAVNFSFTAPTTPGTYTYFAQPLENGVEWFGSEVTLTLTVTAAPVTAHGNSLVYGTNNFPVSVSAGATVNFTYNVTNTGTKAWGANHYLAVVDAGFNVVELGALNGTAVGAGKAVNFSFTAPTTPGTYTYFAQPLENGVEWFGSEVTLTLTVTAAPVTAHGNSLVYGTNNFPVSVSAGATVNFSFNVTNTGTKAWGANHYLAVVDAGFNLVELGALNGTAVGAGKAVNFSFTAPTTPGTYTYFAQPLENGVEWFGSQVTLILTVTAAPVTAHGNSLVYGTNNFPVSVSAGATVNFTYNVTNTGTKAWGANHYLAVVDAGFNLVELGALDGTAVGAGKAVNFSFTTPTTPGTYTYFAQPLENGVEWFGSQVALTLTVTAAPVTAHGNSLVYGTNNFPVSVSAGATVNFTFNVTNTGTKAWGANHYLAVVDAGFNVVELGALNGTAVGAGKAVNFSFTAPTTPGTYTYFAQPLENGVEWFGSQVALTLTVTAAPVTAHGNSLVYGTNNFPVSVSAGATVNFTYNVTNTGTKAWGANHYLAVVDAGFNVVELGALNGTAVGAGKAVNFSFTAPTTPGTYTYFAQPLENGVEWFGSQVVLTLTVH